MYSNERSMRKENTSTKGRDWENLSANTGLKENGGLPVLGLLPASSEVGRLPVSRMVARPFLGWQPCGWVPVRLHSGVSILQCSVAWATVVRPQQVKNQSKRHSTGVTACGELMPCARGFHGPVLLKAMAKLFSCAVGSSAAIEEVSRVCQASWATEVFRTGVVLLGSSDDLVQVVSHVRLCWMTRVTAEFQSPFGSGSPLLEGLAQSWQRCRNGLVPRCGCALCALSNFQIGHFLSSSEQRTVVSKCIALSILVAVVEVARRSRRSRRRPRGVPVVGDQKVRTVAKSRVDGRQKLTIHGPVHRGSILHGQEKDVML